MSLRPSTQLRSRRNRAALPALALAGVVSLSLFAAACGGSHGKGVAQIGSTQTTTTSSNSSGSPSDRRDAAVAYAACMRQHGVPEFPDPDASGTVQASIRKNTPQFKAAERTCQKLLPNTGQPSAQELATHLQQAFAFAVCMRRHGVPRFPDPQKGPDGGPRFPEIGPSTGVNPNSPQFRAGQRACKLLPGSPPEAP